MERLAELDACASAELVRSGECSPRELVDAAIGRIEAANPQLNAVISTRFEQALEEADAVDRSLPFAGVPFLFKDIGAPEEGEASTMGMRLLRDRDFRFPFGSHFAQKIRAAGFIGLGRTNCCELGLCPTTEPEAYGATHNPWDLGRTPGGSSGGSAAAVSAGLVPVAHANDGGGSIRIPAAACGLVGLKPTRGRISWGPVLFDPDVGLAIEGVVSRTVRDTAALLDAYSGNYHGDPYAAPAPTRPWREEVGAAAGAPRLRIGVYSDTPEGALPTDPASARAVEEAAAALAALGHRVEAAAPEPIKLEMFRSGFVDWWAVATAATVHAIGDSIGQEITGADVEPLTWALVERGRSFSGPEFVELRDRVGMFARFAGAWWDDFDLLLTPTLQTPAPRLGELMTGDPATMLARMFRWMPLTAFANASGQPAISVPVDTGELPTGVMFTAGLGREDQLIQVAAQLEQALPWRRLAPMAASVT